MSTFLKETFDKQQRRHGQEENPETIEALFGEHFPSFSRQFDISQLQESSVWRATHLARESAQALIDERGEIKKSLLLCLKLRLEEQLFSLAPSCPQDHPYARHLLHMLQLFSQNPDALQALKRISLPLDHPGAERLIRETLLLPERTLLREHHAKKAVLAALFTRLRQNVGSCFATAPAILVQRDQPLQFLADMSQLLGTGQLRRIHQGIEYTVPLNTSWGSGDLLKPISLMSLGEDPPFTLSWSPGLQAALERAGLLASLDTAEDKRLFLEKYLKQLALFQRNDLFSSLTADQILKNLLLHHFHLTEAEAHEREESSQRPLALPPGEIWIDPVVGSETPEQRAYNQYLQAYEKAKNGFKSLTENALLKAWEFTLASLSEAKADFARWNLYISLGVHPEERCGIGESLHSLITGKLDHIHEELSALQSNYDHLFAQLKSLEGRLRRADSSNQLNWVHAEYQIRKQELNQILHQQDRLDDKGSKLNTLYNTLMRFYGENGKQYFQEVYDPEMHAFAPTLYEDSPAGFRLLYKYGRSNTSLWKPILSATEYIEYLVAFFISTELPLQQLPELAGLEKELSECISAAIATLRRPEFLDQALLRLAHAYQETQNKQDSSPSPTRTPWAYISGGVMSTLVSAYWGCFPHPQETSRWIENETELLIFLIDTVKALPLSEQSLYQKYPDLSLLAFSPTHAFLCKPGWPLFRRGWESELNTYTWMRDEWLAPQRAFLEKVLLDIPMQELLLEKILQLSCLPPPYRALLRKSLDDPFISLSPVRWRESVLQTLSYEKWLTKHHLLLLSEEIDGLLYQSLPFFSQKLLGERLRCLFEQMGSEAEAAVQGLIEEAEEATMHHLLLSAEDLRKSAQALLILGLKRTHSPICYYREIVTAMQQLGFCFPPPLLFADSNWVKSLFGFTLNPGTAELGLWRFDEYGSEGKPMTAWKSYLDGSDPRSWGLYSHPREYGFHSRINYI